MITCSRCGHQNTSDNKFCSKCGNGLVTIQEPVVAAEMYCARCGTKNLSTNRFCSKCGNSINNNNSYAAPQYQQPVYPQQAYYQQPVYPSYPAVTKINPNEVKTKYIMVVTIIALVFMLINATYMLTDLESFQYLYDQSAGSSVTIINTLAFLLVSVYVMMILSAILICPLIIVLVYIVKLRNTPPSQYETNKKYSKFVTIFSIIILVIITALFILSLIFSIKFNNLFVYAFEYDLTSSSFLISAVFLGLLIPALVISTNNTAKIKNIKKEAEEKLKENSDNNK